MVLFWTKSVQWGFGWSCELVPQPFGAISVFPLGIFLQFPKCGNGSLCFEYVVEDCFSRSIGSDGWVVDTFCDMIVSELSC